MGAKIVANSTDDKFSIDMGAIYIEMEKFVYYLAARYANEDLDFHMDELVGELMLELVKGINYYQDKNLPLEQLKAILRRCLDNRIAELRHKTYGTYRFKALISISIEGELYDDGIESQIPHPDPTPEVIYDSLDRVNRTRNRLSISAQEVFDACIYGQARLVLLVWLSSIRSKYSGNSVHIKPWIIAESLGMDETLVKRAFTEIRKAYQEICDE